MSDQKKTVLNQENPRNSGERPYQILGVSLEATDEEIRAAYIAKVKQFPPDRSPAEFERIRDAYALLRDPRRRAMITLFAGNPDAPIVSLIGKRKSERRFAGPDPWLAVLKER